MNTPDREAITAYLTNTVGGLSMREVARRNGVQASTVSRQAKRVEELREWPEWDELLELLSMACDGTDDFVLTDAEVYRAVGVTESDAKHGLRLAAVHLFQRDAVLAVTKAPLAGVFNDGRVVHKVDRSIVLAWLGCGWVKGRTLGSAVRRYEITDGASRVATEDGVEARPAPRPTEKHMGQARYINGKKRWSSEPIDKLRQRSNRGGSAFGFSDEQLTLASHIRVFMLTAEVQPLDSPERRVLANMRTKLGEDMYAVLHFYLGEGQGLEEIEKARGMPARSAKIVLRIAIDQVRHFGLLPKSVLIGEAS